MTSHSSAVYGGPPAHPLKPAAPAVLRTSHDSRASMLYPWRRAGNTSCSRRRRQSGWSKPSKALRERQLEWE